MSRLEPALQQLGVSHHARQRLVELVRRGARQLGDDGLALLRENLLLRLREPLLHSNLFAQIGEDADASDGRAPSWISAADSDTGTRLAAHVEELGAKP